jgi:hypothetical protein
MQFFSFFQLFLSLALDYDTVFNNLSTSGVFFLFDSFLSQAFDYHRVF